ncbi:MAG: inositol monophosphatase [Bacteroidetes bacterium]|nr:inositol monophosphatase [Bacteroidota bacterium]
MTDSTSALLLSTSDLDALLASATYAAREAGTLVHNAQGSDLGVEYKEQGKNNLVTVMDRESENLIQAMLRERHPDIQFLAEEGGGNTDLSRPTWVVDPIDGTVNYAHGIPLYSVSIAAVAEGRPVVGAVFNPNTNEMFTAAAGRGAFLNGRQLRVSDNNDLDHAMLVTGFPYNVGENPFHCIDAFVEFVTMGIPVRRLGSAALDLAYLAAGRFDAYWEVSLGPWDVAAGALLVTEAGGFVGTYSPVPNPSLIVTDRLLASNGRIHEAMRERLLKIAEGADRR